jgi:hypothetical protein
MSQTLSFLQLVSIQYRRVLFHDMVLQMLLGDIAASFRCVTHVVLMHEDHLHGMVQKFQRKLGRLVLIC